jgi:UDP-MurNAc hydroxylase
MKITFLGHAGLYIETGSGSILCDPWFNGTGAFFSSWFPFPDNQTLDRVQLAHPTYLYVSHLHQDHFDPLFLRDHVWKEVTVLLPDYPLNLLERSLRQCGFRKFIYTKNGQAFSVDGLRLMILAMVSPVDGPIGDSGLLVDDGTACIFNQNDSRPADLDLLVPQGPFDAHFVQFSGALWYPMVYQYPEKMVQALGRKKRKNEMARALSYIQHLGASFAFPFAGPPCFLDNELFHLNDFDRNPANTFPDQSVFLEFMQAHGTNNGRLIIPGSSIELCHHNCLIKHPFPDEQVQAIFTEKRAYLETYKARQQPRIVAEKMSWPRGQVDILSSLREWFEPLMAQADNICLGIGGRVVIDCDVQKIVLDFQKRVVEAYASGEWDYRFHIDQALLEYCIIHREEDWVNQIFLSCRFKAWRRRTYNEYLYTFFKCLSAERLQYAERYYARKAVVQQTWESHGYRIQKKCPHLGADLSRFGRIEGDILTCRLHDWQFDLKANRCLTVEGYQIFAQLLDNPANAPILEQNTNLNPSLRTRCSHCWYRPGDKLSDI